MSTRWFDEDGNEIFPKKLNPDEFEPFLEVGGQVDQYRVGIHFYSEKLDKDEITKLIGIQPEQAWNPGELHKIGNSKRSRITDWGNWYFYTERDSTEINEKIKGLLNRLTKDLNHWRILCEKYEVWINVSLYMENWNREFYLSPEVLRLLAERNITVSFDIYFYGEDAENE